MTNRELFLKIKNTRGYKTAGLDVQYKIEVDPHERIVYLIFQESASQQDWKINFDFPRKVYKNQEWKFYVHGGYAKAWKSCKDEVMLELLKAIHNNPTYMVEIIGWSYGGAMSLLAAEDLFYRTQQRAMVVTFGAPKILYFKSTWRHFESAGYFEQHTRTNDIVPWCVPLPWVHHVFELKHAERFSIKGILNTAYNHTHYEDLLE